MPSAEGSEMNIKCNVYYDEFTLYKEKKKMLQYIEENFPVTKEANLVEKHMRDIIDSKIGSLLMANNVITNEQILTFAKKMEEQEKERNKNNGL